MKQSVRLEVSNKLTSIASLIKECAVSVYGINTTLMQETALAALAHESLCDQLKREGYTERVIILINEFGKNVVQLYNDIVASKAPFTQQLDTIFDTYPVPAIKTHKTLLN